MDCQGLDSQGDELSRWGFHCPADVQAIGNVTVSCIAAAQAHSGTPKVHDKLFFLIAVAVYFTILLITTALEVKKTTFVSTDQGRVERTAKSTSLVFKFCSCYPPQHNSAPSPATISIGN